jgi:hypothetical protein
VESRAREGRREGGREGGRERERERERERKRDRRTCVIQPLYGGAGDRELVALRGVRLVVARVSDRRDRGTARCEGGVTRSAVVIRELRDEQSSCGGARGDTQKLATGKLRRRGRKLSFSKVDFFAKTTPAAEYFSLRLVRRNARRALLVRRHLAERSRERDPPALFDVVTETREVLCVATRRFGAKLAFAARAVAFLVVHADAVLFVKALLHAHCGFHLCMCSA